ncbi:hypothetical protein SALBM217S_01759 [Streptomyces griseoloalbus]
MPTGRVIRAGSEVDTNGHRKLFHAPMNTKIATAASMGRDSGSITDQKIRAWPAPSSRAASSSSRVEVLLQDEHHDPGDGTAGSPPPYVSTRSRVSICRNHGTISILRQHQDRRDGEREQDAAPGTP